LTELGPLLLSDLSLNTDEYKASGIPTPIYNQYTWSRLGHILTFDQPAPIGFSYCNNMTDSHTCDGIQWTDELTAQNALAALIAFRTKFQCLSDIDLYLTGESYAGIYIPTFAREILRYNTNQSNNTAPSTIPLKGFAVGDGCLGTETDICVSLTPKNPYGFDGWRLIFLAGHGQIPLSSLHDTMEACRGVGGIVNIGDDGDNKMTLMNSVGDYVSYLRTTRRNVAAEGSDDCEVALDKVTQQVGFVYDYGLYDECTYSNGLLNGAVNDYPCGGDIVMEKMYLNLSVVQNAFHVHSTWFSVDNAGLDFDYTPTEPDLTTFYKELMMNHPDIKVLIYNGGTYKPKNI
jgi:Serine carboxypeptidase